MESVQDDRFELLNDYDLELLLDAKAQEEEEQNSYRNEVSFGRPIRGGHPWISSRTVGTCFEKDHKNVLNHARIWNGLASP